MFLHNHYRNQYYILSWQTPGLCDERIGTGYYSGATPKLYLLRDARRVADQWRRWGEKVRIVPVSLSMKWDDAEAVPNEISG